MYRDSPQEDRSLLLVGHDRKIIALQRDTGKVAWTFKDPRAYDYFVDFAIAYGRVFIPVGAAIVCLVYATGAVIGTTELPSSVVRLMMDDDRLFAIGSRHVFAIDLDGRVLWQAENKLDVAISQPTMGFPGNVIHGFRDSG
jgi:outer membrane protein assembly factor BamB